MKYVKPKSLTWWSGMAIIVVGVLESIQTKTVSGRIAEGLGVIGLRGAIS